MKKDREEKTKFSKILPSNQIITACHIELWVQEMTMNKKLTMIGLKVSLTGTISASESFCSQFCRCQFLLELCNWHIEIMQVPMSVAIMQFLRFYSNYVGGTFCYIYVGRSFCCSYAVGSFCSIYDGESFCSKCVGDNFYWLYAHGSLCCNHASSIFFSALCTWFSIVIMQMSVSVVAMCVAVSCSNFLFLSLTSYFFL